MTYELLTAQYPPRRQGWASDPIRPGLARTDVLGVPVARLRRAEALAEVERLVDHGGPALVAFVNAHTINLARRDDRYRSILAGADLVLNDGAGLAIAGRTTGRPFPENLNGTDFTPEILEMTARRQWPVYFVGARPGVAVRAADRLCGVVPGLNVVGVHHGYFTDAEERALVGRIRDSGAVVVLAGLGNPRQEFWLHQNLVHLGVRLGVGVGAFFDFASGEIDRAPAWMNRFGIEWAHRLALEPRRLWRRYLLGNPVFLARVAADGFRARLSP